MIFLIILMVIASCFFLVVLFGAPYLPTLSHQKETALDMLDLKPGQTLLELGSGDGRVLLAAAKRGINSVGIELNPVLVVFSFFLTLRYRKNVRIIWGNFWRVKWPAADGIFVFLLDKYMTRLDKKIEMTQKKPMKLASFAFKIPDKKITKEKNSIYLYKY